MIMRADRMENTVVLIAHANSVQWHATIQDSYTKADTAYVLVLYG